MTGDCHVRICGSPGVRFPRATRPHLVPSIAEMSYPSTIIKYMFDIRQLDDSSGTITPAPGPAPGSGRQAISTTGPAADPCPPGAAVPLERLEAQICELAGHLAATPARIRPCSESRPVRITRSRMSAFSRPNSISAWLPGLAVTGEVGQRVDVLRLVDVAGRGGEGGVRLE